MYWIDKNSVFGSGKNAIGYGKEIKASELQIAKLVKEGKVGQLPAVPISGDAKKVIELEGIIAGLKKELAEKKAGKKSEKKADKVNDK